MEKLAFAAICFFIVALIIVFFSIFLIILDENKAFKVKRVFKSKIKKNLCPNCKTGASFLLLDERSAMCPYIHAYSGGKCPFYKPFKNKARNLSNK